MSHEVNYIDGKLNGLETIYFENSTQPDRTWTWKDVKMNGTMTRYRRDGTIEYTVEYKDDYVVPGSDKFY